MYFPVWKLPSLSSTLLYTEQPREFLPADSSWGGQNTRWGHSCLGSQIESDEKTWSLMGELPGKIPVFRTGSRELRLHGQLELFD